jgi:hypothetical protein
MTKRRFGCYIWKLFILSMMHFHVGLNALGWVTECSWLGRLHTARLFVGISWITRLDCSLLIWVDYTARLYVAFLLLNNLK